MLYNELAYHVFLISWTKLKDHQQWNVMNLLSRKNFDNPKMSQKTAKKFTKFASDQSLQEIILSGTSGAVLY